MEYAGCKDDRRRKELVKKMYGDMKVYAASLPEDTMLVQHTLMELQRTHLNEATDRRVSDSVPPANRTNISEFAHNSGEHA